MTTHFNAGTPSKVLHELSIEKCRDCLSVVFVAMAMNFSFVCFNAESNFSSVPSSKVNLLHLGHLICVTRWPSAVTCWHVDKDEHKGHSWV